MKLYRPAGLLTVGLFILSLAACSSLPLQSDLLLQHPPSSISSKIELSSVPFNPQSAYQCGPAALATLLQYNVVKVSIEALIEQVYLPARRGSLQPELISTTRRYNLVPHIIEPSMTALLRELDAGHPVLVLQNLGLSIAPQWHYAVVVGYDLKNNQIILRSGEYKRHINDFLLFERTWQRANYWGLVITPATELAVTTTPLKVLKTGLSFEQTDNNAIALTLYQTAIKRWPDNTALLMAAGNVSFNMQQLQQAKRYYQNVIEKQPENASALHNLAQVYIKVNDYKKAEQLVRQAIKIGGRFIDQYNDTLRKIINH